MGRKNAEDVKDGTCVRLYEDGGLDPGALPGAFFAVADVEGREGGSPGSPTAPVTPCGPPSPSVSSKSDMADDTTLIAGPLPGTANPVGKEDLSSSDPTEPDPAGRPLIARSYSSGSSLVFCERKAA
jgi:hypothetical protein